MIPHRLDIDCHRQALVIWHSRTKCRMCISNCSLQQGEGQGMSNGHASRITWQGHNATSSCIADRFCPCCCLTQFGRQLRMRTCRTSEFLSREHVATSWESRPRVLR